MYDVGEVVSNVSVEDLLQRADVTHNCVAGCGFNEGLGVLVHADTPGMILNGYRIDKFHTLDEEKLLQYIVI
jgi:hypothetical protein